MELRGAVYIVNNTGPNIEHKGTPNIISMGLDKLKTMFELTDNPFPLVSSNVKGLSQSVQEGLVTYFVKPP